ncbi:hotdog fold thioesterase [Novosphingobium sp. SCN 63-17]|uniref:hotdog fold thioesterase n=1 Tax=Novosphingobium sp. SCN 63-17 TaxID=1660120 RepID=UPI00086D840B|nr:hotdog fold thioesterase [Novosphingobium sp. SCN 63-17]ODU79756.1 MAG: thioesterase [Novosphingobium sp. SCN 63-17]
MNSGAERHELTELRKMLHIAPFHRWLGVDIVDLTERELILEMPWRDEIVSNPMIGSAHGGILSALIDLTGLYTVNAMGGTARATADLRVDFHRPATSGPLRAIGSVVKLGRQLSVAETRIEDTAQRLLASGRGAYVG